MALKEPPPYVEGHNLLAGKSVLVTAAAGAGIGFAAAGLLTPAWASLAMVLSSALVMVNSLRLKADVGAGPLNKTSQRRRAVRAVDLALSGQAASL